MTRITLAVVSALLMAGMSLPAQELPKKEAAQLLAKASTKADHAKLANHYTALAARYDAEAAEHAAMAKAYRTHPSTSEMKRPMAPDTSAHCEHLAQTLAEAAKRARQLADHHRALAK